MLKNVSPYNVEDVIDGQYFFQIIQHFLLIDVLRI